MLAAMDDDGLRVGIHLAPVLHTATEYAVEHDHDGRRVSMSSDGPDGPQEGGQVREAMTCDECAVTVHLEIDVETNLDGMERFDALVRVAGAASAGHLPPDHRFGLPTPLDCPLCVALADLTEPLPGEP
jgi:hypothetical protein